MRILAEDRTRTTVADAGVLHGQDQVPAEAANRLAVAAVAAAAATLDHLVPHALR